MLEKSKIWTSIDTEKINNSFLLFFAKIIEMNNYPVKVEQKQKIVKYILKNPNFFD
jgi:hypothetical protein